MKLKRTCYWMGLVLLAGAIWLRALWPDRNGLRVVMLDVGQGDSILIRSPSGRAILVDGGGRPQYRSNAFDTGASIVIPALRAEGVRFLDAVVLTHAHDDHAGGLPAVLERFPVRLVLDNARPCPSAAYRRFLEAIRRHRLPYHQARAGQRLDLGDGVSLEVVWPTPEALQSPEMDLNAVSTVLYLTYRAFTCFLMADAGVEAERHLIAQNPARHCTLLKVGHHGSSSATSREWLQTIQPKAAFISVGAGNVFGHPSPSVLNRLEERRIQTFRTDRNGAIWLETDGEEVRVGCCCTE